VLDALRASEERYRILFENNPQPMWVEDAESGTFLAVNEAAVRHYGWPRERFLTLRSADLRLDPGAGAEQRAGSPAVERHRTASGEAHDLELSVHEVVFEGRRALLVAAFDVTARRKAQARLLQAAFYDPVTGLPDRRRIHDGRGDRGRRARPPLARAAVPDRRARSVRGSLDRDRAGRTGDGAGGAPAARRGHGDVSRQGARLAPCGVRFLDARARDGGAAHRERAAPRAGARRDAGPLPAHRRALQRQDARRRGAGAVGTPRARARAAERIHPPRRGDRPGGPARALGAGRGVPRARCLAGAHQSLGEP